MPTTTPQPAPLTGPTWARLSAAALAGGVLLWACWPTLATFADIWATNPQYSHGYLVPAFAAFLLWHRRAMYDPARRGGNWFGFVLLAVGCGLKLVGAYFAFVTPDRLSVVVLVAGAVGAVGGWAALRWAWPAVAYLLFMVPLPGRVETLLAGPMQRFATVVCANILQTLGFFAQADGTVIILSEVDLGVVEACSGLRMLIAFLAMSTAVALVIDRPVWQKLAVVAGALPVALACNVARIVVTAVLYETVDKKWADLVFHDLAGWLMMPAGLALLWVELAFLSRLIVPRTWAGPRRPPTPGRVTAGGTRTQAGRPSPATS